MTIFGDDDDEDINMRDLGKAILIIFYVLAFVFPTQKCMVWSELMAKHITHTEADCNTCSVWCWNACAVAMWREWTLTLINIAYVFSIKEIITPATVPTFVTHTHTQLQNVDLIQYFIQTTCKIDVVSRICVTYISHQILSLNGRIPLYIGRPTW